MHTLASLLPATIPHAWSAHSAHCHMYCVIGLQVIAKLGPQYIHDLLPNKHAEQFGLTREAAELEFLKVTHISLSLHAPPLTCPTPHTSHPSHSPPLLTGSPETS